MRERFWMSVSRLLRPLAVVAFGAAVLVIPSCGGGGGAPSTPIVTPTAVPTATPPTGGGGGTSASCKIGPGSQDTDCGKSSARLWPQLEAAMDLTTQQKPAVVDKNDVALQGSQLYKVVDVDGFLDGTIDNLRKSGLCAQRDPADYMYQRIQVKNENGYSETYDVISSAGYIRRGNGTYYETCTPASFPVDLGTEAPPAGSGCGAPYPPPVNRFRVHVYVQNTDTTTLDSTPLVVDPIYCAEIGYPGRAECPIRPEGSPERVPCETWAVGYAQDTGRAGPTWTHVTDESPAGVLCTGKASGCENHPSNQYQVNVYTPGWYRACGRNGACGSFNVER
ncbi:MAG TPA: hypothetical protein VF902_02800 [Coriobacteriia bacterium]